MWGTNTGVSQGMIPGRKYLGPLFLITAPPIVVFIVWYTNYHLNGSFAALFDKISAEGVVDTLKSMVPSPFEPKAWKIIGTYAFVQAMIMRFVPGKKFIGPLTPKGNTPEYNANGV